MSITTAETERQLAQLQGDVRETYTLLTEVDQRLMARIDSVEANLGGRIDSVEATLADHGGMLANHGKMLAEHGRMLAEIVSLLKPKDSE